MLLIETKKYYSKTVIELRENDGRGDNMGCFKIKGNGEYQ